MNPIKSIKRAFAYRKMYNELSKLSDRELYDIGIDRGNIPYIIKQML